MVVHCAAQLQQGFCLHETFCASGKLVLVSLHHLQRPAEAGGNVNEFNTQKNMAYRCAMFNASTFITTLTNTS
jgi:hypothetical protein